MPPRLGKVRRAKTMKTQLRWVKERTRQELPQLMASPWGKEREHKARTMKTRLLLRGKESLLRMLCRTQAVKESLERKLCPRQGVKESLLRMLFQVVKESPGMEPWRVKESRQGVKEGMTMLQRLGLPWVKARSRVGRTMKTPLTASVPLARAKMAGKVREGMTTQLAKQTLRGRRANGRGGSMQSRRQTHQGRKEEMARAGNTVLKAVSQPTNR
jgi:hypothetical protein